MFRRVTLITMLLLAAGVGGCSPAVKKTAEARPVPPWLQAPVTEKIAEPADDPAALCPASVRLYVRVDGLKRWRAGARADPMVEYVNRVIGSVQPPGLWRQAGRRLGLDAAGVLDAYFGDVVAVVEQKIDGHKAVVVMSRADHDALAKLPGAVDAEPYSGLHHVGPFTLLRLREGEKDYAMAIGHRWMMLTEAEDVEHLLTLITGVATGEAALRDDEAYQKMLAKLPASQERSVVLFSRNSRDTEHHALTVVEHGAMETVDYVARIPRLDEYVQAPPPEVPPEVPPEASPEVLPEVPPATPSGEVQFGPLPAGTIAAVSVNVLEGSLDRLAHRQSHGVRLVEGLRPPIVLFLGSVPGAEVEPDPGIEVPVLGFALPADTPELAKKLDALVRMLHLVLSIGELNPVQTVFGIRTLSHGQVTYHEADFGRAIARRFDDNDLGRLANLPDAAGLTRLSFGRIGDWYVVCSQRTFFNRCIDAEADPSRRLTAAADFDGFGFTDRPRLLASALTRAPELSRLVEGVADFYRRAHLDHDNLVAAQIDTAPPADRLDIESPMRYIAGALKHRRSFSFQMWSDPADSIQPDQPMLRARMHIAGP